MRSIILAALIVLAAPAAAFAYCPVVTDVSETPSLKTQTAVALCREAEVSNTAKALQQQAYFQSELAAQQQMLNAQSRLQKTYDAAVPMPQVKF